MTSVGKLSIVSDELLGTISTQGCLILNLGFKFSFSRICFDCFTFFLRTISAFVWYKLHRNHDPEYSVNKEERMIFVLRNGVFRLTVNRTL